MSAHATESLARAAPRVQNETNAIPFAARIPGPMVEPRGGNEGGLGMVASRFGGPSRVQQGAATGLSANAPSRSTLDGTAPPDGHTGGDGFAYYYGPDGKFYQAIQDAVNTSVVGAGDKFTADQLDNTILGKLKSSGLFSQDQLDAIRSGENNAETHGGGFLETNKGGRNTGGFESSWFSNIMAAVNDANPLATRIAKLPPDIVDPPVVTPPAITETPTTPQSVGGSTADDLKKLIEANVGGSAGGGTGTGPAPSALANVPPTLQTVGGSSGTNYPLIIGALALIGGGWYYMTHKHKKHTGEHAA